MMDAKSADQMDFLMEITTAGWTEFQMAHCLAD